MGATTDPLTALSIALLPGRPVPSSAFAGTFEATVVSSNATEVVVTLNGFDTANAATWTARYEKRPGATPSTPPKGTLCLLAIPGGIASTPANGATPSQPAYTPMPWVVAFSGWPS